MLLILGRGLRSVARVPWRYAVILKPLWLGAADVVLSNSVGLEMASDNCRYVTYTQYIVYLTGMGGFQQTPFNHSGINPMPAS